MLGTTNTTGVQSAMTDLSISLNGTKKLTYNGKTDVSLDITAAGVGAAAASHTHNYLPLTGGTLTGNVKYNMYGRLLAPLEVYGGDAYGMGILVCGCGATIVGAGESGINLKSTVEATNESLHLASDTNIYFYTNCNTFANKKQITLDDSLNLYPANNTGSIGTSGNRWKSGYFNSLLVGTSLTVYQPTYQAIADCKPSIIFTNDSNGGGSQQVWLKYSDYDSYKIPAGLTICGQQGNEYLIVDGDIKTNKGYLYSTTHVVFNSGTTTSGGLKVTATIPSAETSGQTVTGNRYPISWWGHEYYGLGVLVGDGGATIVGAGESGGSLKSALGITGGTETLYLTSDNTIRFFTNCNTIANRIESTIDNAGKYTGRYINATYGYQFNGTAGKISAVQSGTPNTNMVWMW